jgi:hypothetical protein
MTRTRPRATMPPGRCASPAPRRGRSVLLVGVALTGVLSALAHPLLARHALCAQHGEVIHLAAGGSAGGPGALEAITPLPDAAAASSRIPDGLEGADDHCALFSQRRDPVATPARAPLAIRAAAGQEPRVLDRAVLRPAGLEPRRLAPKQSPPA